MQIGEAHGSMQLSRSGAHSIWRMGLDLVLVPIDTSWQIKKENARRAGEDQCDNRQE
ncbi:MAG: hypothetical protein K2Q06_02930 [Parvularculaceae bacterium]|nr:hypothetical protein [Parvularculaceae bacterium]